MGYNPFTQVGRKKAVEEGESGEDEEEEEDEKDENEEEKGEEEEVKADSSVMI